MKRALILLLAMISVMASPGSAAVAVAQDARVVIRSFDGPRASRVRRAAVRSLRRRVQLVSSRDVTRAARRLGVDLASPGGRVAVARELELTSMLEGTVAREGRAWSADLRLFEGATGETMARTSITARSARQLEARVRRRVWRDLAEDLVAAEAPRGPGLAPDIEDVVPSVHDEEPEPDRDEVERDDDSGVAVSAVAAGRALRLSAGVELFGRRFRYEDDIFAALNQYQLRLGPALIVDGEWFPGAHFGDGIAGTFGLTMRYRRALGIESAASRSDNVVFETKARALEVGALARHGFGGAEVRLAVAFGGERYALSGPDGVEAGIPDAGYRYVRVGAGTRIVVSERIGVDVDAGYRHLMELGELDDDAWFPRAEGAGLDLSAGLRVGLGAGFEARWGVDLRRYWFSLNTEPGDARVAGGALDRFVATSLSLAYAH